MASHFSTIGIPLKSREEFEKYAEVAVNNGELIETPLGTYVRFRMGKGAELWGQLNTDNEIIGINPHFTGDASAKVRLVCKVDTPESNELDGTYYAEAEPGAEGEYIYPFAFDMPDGSAWEFSCPEIREVQLAAFAHELSIFDDDEAFDASQEQKPGYAAESFIPSGLFVEEGAAVEAAAVFTGHVLSFERIENTLTGAFFYHIKVKTLGADIDVVADPKLVGREIRIGGVVSGSFWLSGRVLN